MTLSPRQRVEAMRAVEWVAREGAHWHPDEYEELEEVPAQMPVKAWR